jgi:uncharacterized protein (DUF1810 family)
MADPYNLQRFVDAQERIHEQVCAELRRGRKTSHWIWFIFPQIQGLGSSELAQRFAISSLAEAKAYFENPILGPRLLECTRLVNLIQGCMIEQIFGYPDNLKFHSCMTLFAHATPDNVMFLYALRKYYGGEFDAATLARINVPCLR